MSSFSNLEILMINVDLDKPVIINNKNCTKLRMSAANANGNLMNDIDPLIYVFLVFYYFNY